MECSPDNELILLMPVVSGFDWLLAFLKHKRDLCNSFCYNILIAGEDKHPGFKP